MTGIIVLDVRKEFETQRVDPWPGAAAAASTAVTDAAYVLFNAAVSSGRRVQAAT